MIILPLKPTSNGTSVFELDGPWSCCDIRVRYGSDQVISEIMFLVCIQGFIWSVVNMLHYFVTLRISFVLDSHKFLIVRILASLEGWLRESLFMSNGTSAQYVVNCSFSRWAS